MTSPLLSLIGTEVSRYLYPPSATPFVVLLGGGVGIVSSSCFRIDNNLLPPSSSTLLKGFIFSCNIRFMFLYGLIVKYRQLYPCKKTHHQKNKLCSEEDVKQFLHWECIYPGIKPIKAKSIQTRDRYTDNPITKNYCF